MSCDGGSASDGERWKPIGPGPVTPFMNTLIRPVLLAWFGPEWSRAAWIVFVISAAGEWDVTK